MAFTYSILPSDRIVFVIANGRVSYAESLKIGTELANDARFEPGFRVVVDMRRMEFEAQIEFAEFAPELSRLRERFQGPIAVVTETSRLERMQRIASVMTQEYAFPMRAFENLRDAQAWLGRST